MKGHRLFVFVTVAALAVSAAVAVGGFYFLLDAPIALRAPIELTIAPGESVHSVTERLVQTGVVRNARVVRFLARSTGADRDIRHGPHTFAGVLTPSQVLDELMRAPQPTTRLTIAEGSTWAEIAAQLERDGLASAAAYRDAVCDPAWLASIGASPTANCAEGLLFPDTYNLAPGMSAKEIAALQVRRFQEVIDALLRGLEATADYALVDLAATTDAAARWKEDPRARAQLLADTVTLASIIEEEAKLAEERPLISSVFHNRLRRGVRLQADPTVLYGRMVAGVPWDKKLLHHHLREPGPYNTYTSDGLPPGPICNPGRDSLYAALHPAPTQYLYFVARGEDGSHEFNATLAQHNKAVARLRAHRRHGDGLTFAEPSLSLRGTSAAAGSTR